MESPHFKLLCFWQTQVSTLICDSKQLKNLAAISSSLNSIKNVIYFEDEGSSGAKEWESTSNWTITSFSEVEKLGQESPVHPTLPSKNGVAVVMYTSGSTGLPKVCSLYLPSLNCISVVGYGSNADPNNIFRKFCYSAIGWIMYNSTSYFLKPNVAFL